MIKRVDNKNTYCILGVEECLLSIRDLQEDNHPTVLTIVDADSNSLNIVFTDAQQIEYIIDALKKIKKSVKKVEKILLKKTNKDV